MKKVDRYFYPAIFTYAPGQEIAVDFPDLNSATSGTNEDDALISARELLGCVLFGLEEDGEKIPSPPPLSDIKPESVNFVTNCFPNIAYFRCLLLVFIVQNCVPNGWKNNAVS